LVTKPEEIDEAPNQEDIGDAKKIEKQIDQYLKDYPSQTKRVNTFKVNLHDRVGEPSRQTKKIIIQLYLENGWSHVEFKSKYVDSDLSSYLYFVELKKKVGEEDEDESPSPLSRRELTYSVIRESEWMGSGDISKLLWEEMKAALESWVRKEIKQNGFSNLIVIKKLETYCHKIVNGKMKAISIPYEDVIALEKISRNMDVHYTTILHYVLEPYPQVDMMVHSGGGNMTIEFFDKNSRRA
jgi:hypothetical protein